jgi:hypothetical protein
VPLQGGDGGYIDQGELARRIGRSGAVVQSDNPGRHDRQIGDLHRRRSAAETQQAVHKVEEEGERLGEPGRGQVSSGLLPRWSCVWVPEQLEVMLWCHDRG